MVASVICCSCSTVLSVLDIFPLVYQDKGTGETSLFSHLIDVLSQSDLLIADRYYTSFAIIALLIKQGTPLVFRQRSTVKSDFRRGQRLGTKDHIIHLIKPKKNQSGCQKKTLLNYLMLSMYVNILSKELFM